MVVAGYGLRGEFREGGGHRVPHFWLKLAAVVREWDAVVLASSYEDCSCWEYDRVREDSWIRHRADGLDSSCAHRGTDRDDMGVCRRVGVLLWTRERGILSIKGAGHVYVVN